MKPDLYTKTMLTVIAACLLHISMGRPGLMAQAEAQAKGQPGGQPVYITGWQHSGDKGVNALENKPLPVTVVMSK